MSRSPEGYGSSGASGLIHLAAKGVEKTTNDLSLSLLSLPVQHYCLYIENHPQLMSSPDWNEEGVTLLEWTTEEFMWWVAVLLSLLFVSERANTSVVSLMV